MALVPEAMALVPGVMAVVPGVMALVPEVMTLVPEVMALGPEVMTLVPEVMALVPGVMALVPEVMTLEHIPVRLDRARPLSYLRDAPALPIRTPNPSKDQQIVRAGRSSSWFFGDPPGGKTGQRPPAPMLEMTHVQIHWPENPPPLAGKPATPAVRPSASRTIHLLQPMEITRAPAPRPPVRPPPAELARPVL
jgi:hypothetical protein